LATLPKKEDNGSGVGVDVGAASMMVIGVIVGLSKSSREGGSAIWVRTEDRVGSKVGVIVEFGINVGSGGTSSSSGF
jgi:hypothetical protein